MAYLEIEVRRKLVQPPPPPPMPEPRHLEPMAYCIEEAAEVMSLSRTAVFGLLKDGLLKAVRRGKRVIIPKTEIQAYLDAHAA